MKPWQIVLGVVIIAGGWVAWNARRERRIRAVMALHNATRAEAVALEGL